MSAWFYSRIESFWTRDVLARVLRLESYPGALILRLIFTAKEERKK